jgi:hypothetical protein
MNSSTILSLNNNFFTPPNILTSKSHESDPLTLIRESIILNDGLIGGNQLNEMIKEHILCGRSLETFYGWSNSYNSFKPSNDEEHHAAFFLFLIEVFKFYIGNRSKATASNLALVVNLLRLYTADLPSIVHGIRQAITDENDTVIDIDL